MRQAPRDDSEMLGRLVDLFEEDGPTTAEEIDAELRMEGIDPVELRAGTDAFIDSLVRSSPLDWRNCGAQERAAAELALQQSPNPTEATRAGILDAIRRVLERVPSLGTTPLVQVHCRNFEKSTDEDLASLLADLRFLETLQRGPGRDK